MMAIFRQLQDEQYPVFAVFPNVEMDGFKL